MPTTRRLVPRHHRRRATYARRRRTSAWRSAATTCGRIEERLRSARRDWGLAAGFEADPEDVDDVIRRRDPQFDLTADLVAAAPSARAVAAVHRRVRADWRSLWASLGRSAPPPDKPLVTTLVQDVRNVVMLPGEAADALRRTENRADRAAAARARSGAGRRGPERSAAEDPGAPRPRRPVAGARLAVLPPCRATPDAAAGGARGDARRGDRGRRRRPRVRGAAPARRGRLIGEGDREQRGAAVVVEADRAGWSPGGDASAKNVLPSGRRVGVPSCPLARSSRAVVACGGRYPNTTR